MARMVRIPVMRATKRAKRANPLPSRKVKAISPAKRASPVKMRAKTHPRMLATPVPESTIKLTR